ncbi:Mrp/NBP35 family ATP-binding protein [Candidatus Sumerlaeota bacterium]|nr:Mrp/NBP35 family ATP-binding protein [Candidatus Sumerlaeota bacterium]
MSSKEEQNRVLEALGAVNEPDVGRGVAELEMVRNIQVEGGGVTLELALVNPATPHREKLERDCIEALKSAGGFSAAKVTIVNPEPDTEARTRETLRNVKNTIAVASGKGGVGKSTTAVNIAMALSFTGARVGILDADIYGPSIPTMLYTDQTPEAPEQGVILPGVAMGIKVISIAYFMRRGQAAIMRGPMVTGATMQFLQQVDWGVLDYLVIDYPPGTGDIQLTLSQNAPLTGAVVVTTPQDIALTDVERAVDMFEKTGVPVLGVCETMSSFICDGCGKEHFIFRSGGGQRIANSIGVPFLGGVPIDPKVADSGDKGFPIVHSHPDSEPAKAYKQIAESVAAQLAIYSAESGHYLKSFQLDWQAM